MRRIPGWAWVTAGIVFALGVLFFFQTSDPMILIAGVMAAAMLLVVMTVLGLLKVGIDTMGRSGIRVKCGACGGLNLEDATLCSQCGGRT